MHPLFPKTISMTWTATVVDVGSDGLVSPRCQKCRCELDVHQPEEDRPDQLLGTCPACHAWHLVEVAPDGAEAVVLAIPGLDEVRRKLIAGRRASRSKPGPSKDARSLVRIGTNSRLA